MIPDKSCRPGAFSCSMHPTYEKPRLGLRHHGTVAGTLGIGTVGCLVLMRFADRPLAQHFHSHSGWLFHLAASITNAGEAIWLLLPTFAIYLAARIVWRSPLWAARALFVFSAVAVSGLAVDVIKPLLGRARPTLLFTQHIYGFSYLHLTAAYESFPSGHAACTAGAGLALGLLARRYRALWVTLGLLLGLTRVITTAHYLSDVLAGMLIAAWTVFALEPLFARHGVLFGPARALQPAARRSALALRLFGSTLPRPAPSPVATSTPAPAPGSD